MIRDFIYGDQDKLEANEFSCFEGLPDVFKDDAYAKFTLEDEGEIKCIICFTDHGAGRFAAFFLMPDGVGLKHARALKRFIHAKAIVYGAKMILTYSLDCDLINRWHRFLGFSTYNAIVADGKTFNKWVIEWA